MDNQNPQTPSNSGKNPKKSSHNTIDAFIIKAKTALTNAKLPDIAPLIAKKGYSTADIDTALVQLVTLKGLNATQQNHKAAKQKATENLHALKDNLAQLFAEHITAARIAFKDDHEKLTKLGVEGKRSQNFAGFVKETRQFYGAALDDADIKAGMAAKDVDDKTLQDCLNSSNQLEDLKAAQTKTSGIKQATTSLRDKQYQEFKSWFSDFKAMAILATKKHPQMREQLGFKE